MANTYTQLHIQFVFAVKYRAALIEKSWKEELHKYITGIIQENDHKVLQINSMPDHIHILAGIRPAQSISSLIQNVKTESSKWIKNKKLCKSFKWQDDSVHSLIPKVMCQMLFAIYKTRKRIIENKLFLKNIAIS